MSPELSVASGKKEIAFQTVWETDPRGKNHYQSPSWYRYVGEGPGTSFGDDWLHFYHPDDREYLRSEWEKALASEGAHPYDIEVRIRRQDGEYRWFRVQGTPVRNGSGQVVKWLGSCVDIHERKLSELRTDKIAKVSGERDLRGGLARVFVSHPIVALRDIFRFGALERRLFLVVFVGLLPLVFLSFATLHEGAQNQRRQLIDAAGDTMLAIATAVDSELNMSMAALDALATSPRLASNDLAGFHLEAKEFLARRPNWGNIVLSTPDAAQVMNARVPFGTKLPDRVDPEGIAETVLSGKPQVGNIVFGPVLQKPAFAVRVPIKQGNSIKYVLNAVLWPDAMLELLHRQRIPENGVVAIFDRSHNVVARSRKHDAWVGKPASEQLLRLLQTGGESGWAETVTLDGVKAYSVFRRSPVTGWSAAIGIPRHLLDEPVARAYWALGGSIVISMVLGLFAAFFTARSITQPMRELEQAAIAVGRGELPPHPGSDLPEIQRAADALARAHIERETLLQREREARFMEQEARLIAEKANQAKDEFLAMLGHELRNPLAAIQTSSKILEQERASKSMTDQAQRIIRRQVAHLTRLTDDLLDTSRVMQGKINLDRKAVDLAAVVRATINTLRDTGGLAQHDIQSSLEEAWVSADVTRMEQVVANLLTNATKYTPSPGTIAVSVAREGEFAVLRVRDSGLGIEPDLLPRVFDLFVQGRRSLDRSQGGLGIGLTLVRRLTELHGGTAEARSDGAGKGSEFVIRVPAIEKPVVESASAAQAIAGKVLNIVVVEDNADIRQTLRVLLELEGHEVHEAADGQAGLESILREQADVALVDIGLPVLDGFALAKAVRERQSRHIRLIAITGYGNRKEIDRGAQAGFDDYIVKPIELTRLMKVLAHG